MAPSTARSKPEPGRYALQPCTDGMCSNQSASCSSIQALLRYLEGRPLQSDSSAQGEGGLFDWQIIFMVLWLPAKWA